jgi:hypothetical protein
MLSFFYFSPVGHMNHWWSMMLQLQLGNLLMLLALWTAARLPHSWRANIFAAICCWLATYTITNGLLVFLICAFLIFISSSSWRQGLLKLIFWVSNFLAVSILYFPGLPHEAVSINFWKIVQFSLVYLGLPFGGIVDFQFTGPFSSPPDVIFNGLVGLLLCLCSATIIGRLWLKRKINSPPSLFLVGCFIFAISSALVTAMGRSEFGAAYGNSSRYVIYSSYLIYGLLHYFASVYPNNSEDQKWAPIINWGGVKNYLPYLVSALIIFCGVKTYLRGFEVYRGAHDFNARLIEVYANSKSSDEELKLFYPDPTIARQVKTKMQQLNLGVFRYRTLNKMEIPQPSNFVEGLPLPDDAFVIQHIKPKFDNMIGVDVRFITWSKKGPDVTLAWELQDGDHALIERGLISRRPIFDWGYLPISFKKQLDSSSKSYYLILSFPDFNSGNKAAGLPLYSSSPEFPAALIERKGEAATSARGTINLRLQFSD